jgi:hypothetical protein
MKGSSCDTVATPESVRGTVTVVKLDCGTVMRLTVDKLPSTNVRVKVGSDVVSVDPRAARVSARSVLATNRMIRTSDWELMLYL